MADYWADLIGNAVLGGYLAQMDLRGHSIPAPPQFSQQQDNQFHEAHHLVMPSDIPLAGGVGGTSFTVGSGNMP